MPRSASPALVTIHDRDDPRVAAFCDVRERDLVGRQGAFIAEGEVVLRLLAADGARRTGHRLASVLLSEAQAGRLADLVAQLPPEVPVHVAAQPVMDAIAGFPIHRGILALGRAAAPVPAAERLAALGPRALVVAALGIANHDNMGGLFRNAAAFGADLVLIDAAACDPLYRKAIRVSVGASLTVPFARVASGATLLDLLDAHGFTALALSPAGGERLAELRRPPRVAPVFGTEGPGLDAALMARARSIAIPMAGGFDSLNVATTCGIVLYHLTQASG